MKDIKLIIINCNDEEITYEWAGINTLIACYKNSVHFPILDDTVKESFINGNRIENSNITIVNDFMELLEEEFNIKFL